MSAVEIREDIIDRAVSEINLSFDSATPKDHTVLPLWVDCDYKKKFEELQSRSDKEFGKKAKELLYQLIDRAWEKI